MSGFAITPELLVSLATLITAITALIRVLQTHQVVTKAASDVAVVKEQTNGVLAAKDEQIAQLSATQAAHPNRSTPPSAPFN